MREQRGLQALGIRFEHVSNCISTRTSWDWLMKPIC